MQLLRTGFLEGIEIKIAIVGFHFPFLNPLNQISLLQLIMDKIFNGYNFEVKFFCKFHQFRKPCHGSIIIHDFTNHPAFFKAGHFGKVYGCFGMSGTFQYAALLCAQGKNMSRAHKISGFCIFVH